MDRFQNTAQPDWDWWSRLWPAPGAMLRELGLASGDDVAEVGSGNGYFALPAARVVEPGTVYAVDIDEELLAELETLAAQNDVRNVETTTEDARALDRALPEPVDVVLEANTFHGVDDVEAVVASAHDALAPGGRLVVVNWRPLDRAETVLAGAPRGPPTDLRLGPAETEQAVIAAASFERTRTVDLPPYHYAVVFESVR